MKSKINIIFFLVSGLVLSLFFSACSDDDGDTKPPVINLISPAEGAELEVGTYMELIMDLVDDNMLQSYKLEIHNNFDGHDHGHDHDHNHSKALKAAVTEPFSVQKVWNLSSQSEKINHKEILIPENATPGKYHLMIYCTDASGNESYVARNIVIVEEGHDHEHDH